MNIKSHMFLLGIFPIFAITILPVINAAVEANADADANAGTQIRRYDPPNVEDCGLVHIKDKKILGGSNAAYGSHPWHGAMFSYINFNWRYWCGSSLVNNRWLVTAAHCQYDWWNNLIPIQYIYIRLGEWDFRNPERHVPENYNVVRRKIHPRYINFAPYPNDITLLKLDVDVSFKVHISPICFPKSDLNIFDRTANVPGWGIYRQNPSISPAILQEVDVQVINDTECVRWFRTVWYNYRSYNESFCAGYKRGGRGTCYGDSGGGLTLEEDGKHVLIGVVSWSINCSLPNVPTVYAYVQNYVPWIKNIIT